MKAFVSILAISTTGVSLSCLAHAPTGVSELYINIKGVCSDGKGVGELVML